MLNKLHQFFRQILNETKFAGNTYFVGGCVRDFYRDKPAKDIDLVVNLENGSKDLAYFIFNFVNKFGKNIITNPFQLGHYPIYSITFKENFTYNGQVYPVKDLTLEIADTMNETFPDVDSRQRDVAFGTLKDDIMRRDFSINSGLIDVVSFKFLDLGSGTILKDIKRGLIRCNEENDKYITMIFTNDPLRILRGLVFAARFNFTIDPKVLNLMYQNVHRLEIVSKERIVAEVKKALDVRYGAYSLVKLLSTIHALEYVFPGIENLKKVYQVTVNEDGTFAWDVRRIHLEGKTVFDHTMAVLRFTKPGFINGLAAIYHDAGKLEPEYKDGKVRFIHHEFKSAKIVEQIFPQLKIDNETTKAVKFLVQNHMKLHLLPDYSKKSLRRFIREIPSDELRFMLYDLCNADCLGTVQEIDGVLTSCKPHDEPIELIENLIKEDNISVEKPFRYFNGNEIMEIFNVTGKQVGDALKIMFQVQDEYGFDQDREFIIKKMKERIKK